MERSMAPAYSFPIGHGGRFLRSSGCIRTRYERTSFRTNYIPRLAVAHVSASTHVSGVRLELGSRVGPVEAARTGLNRHLTGVWVTRGHRAPQFTQVTAGGGEMFREIPRRVGNG